MSRPALTHLFSIVCHRLEDSPQCVKADSHIQQVGRKEEMVEISQAGPGEVPGNVQERLQHTAVKTIKYLTETRECSK